MTLAPPWRRPPLSGDDRHGRFVAGMKLVLPGLAVLLLGVLVAWPWVSDHIAGFSVEFASFDPRGVETGSVVNPRYLGTDRNNNPFVVTADAATDLGASDGRLRLVNPKGDLLQSSGRWLSLGSDIGYVTNSRQRIELESNVLFYRDDGLQFRTRAATIDLEHNRAFGVEPVTGEGPALQITSAEGFAVEEAGARILFQGRTRLILNDSSESRP